MVQSPLKAFKNLSLNEILHIIDVMREAEVADDDDDNDESTMSTIKRAPTSNSNYFDTNNNNTLKRSSSQSNTLPSVPKVHMGAGFMKIFNECPLKIHSSSFWIRAKSDG